MTDTWFVRERQKWIKEMFDIFGFLRREHIIKKFGVSVQQASIDLSKFQKENIDYIEYDKSKKLYYNKSGGKFFSPKQAKIIEDALDDYRHGDLTMCEAVNAIERTVYEEL